MANIMSNGLFTKLLWPGVNSAYEAGYKSWKPIWPSIFAYNTSEKEREEDVSITGFGLAQRKSEGSSISFDSAKQSYPTIYTHVAYALGFIITFEQIEDNLYIDFGSKAGFYLGKSQTQTKDILAANIFNSAFDPLVKYGDGVNFISNAHPTDAGNQSNLLAAASLSEVTLESALTQISDVRDERGLRVPTLETSLVVPPQLFWQAIRILRNPERPESTYRDINAMYTTGRFPDGIIQNIYFTNPTAYFVLTDATDGLKIFQRNTPILRDHNDFDTMNAKFSGYERYVFGFSNWRCAFGSAGA